MITISNNILKNTIIIASLILAIGVLVLGINEASKNKIDPFWNTLDTILAVNGVDIAKLKNYDTHNPMVAKHKIITIDKDFRFIEQKYKELHKNSSDTVPILFLMSSPFMPDWDTAKIIPIINQLISKKSIIISGVTGSGKSTIVERISKMIAGNPERVLTLLCVQKMEVEYHKEWVGYRSENGFFKGKLLKFYETCFANPDKNYVFIIDDVDKIYPETFFGSSVWNEMDNPAYKNRIDGYDREIQIPPNFYLISVTHGGASSTIEFNNEHVRRLGEKINIYPDYKEFLLYIKKKMIKQKLSVPHIKKLVYFFVEANNYIAKNYEPGLTLGQWSTINKQLKPEDFDKFVNSFVEHVNSFKTKSTLSREAFEDIIYASENEGVEPNTNLFYKAYQGLQSTGLFSEVTVGLTFAMLSAIFGWLFVMKKRKFIKNLEYDIVDIIKKFKSFEIDYETALKFVVDYKYNLEKLILKRKVNYEETSFLLLFIDDQMKKIEEFNKMNLVSKEFMDTFEQYMQDGVIDAKEYRTLNQFLDNIRNALSPEVYYNLKKRIDELHSNPSE